MKEHEAYGAPIERGIIRSVSNGSYTVESCDRDGVISPALAAAGIDTYSVGDRVYFFLYDDGTGMILFPMA